MFKPVNQDLKFQKRKEMASSSRTGRFLRGKDVDNKLIQDRASNMVLVGSDVEALYPSLEDTKVADTIFRAIMETEVGFDGIDFQEGVRYIALNSTAKECRLGELRRVLPRRRHVNGTRPGVTGEGPLGPDCGDQEQWVFPTVELTKREKRLIIATVMKIAVLVLFRSHVYTFGGKFFLQKRGGPIGLRSTCAIARIVMLDWDDRWLWMLTKNNIRLEQKARYMDDLRVWLYAIRLGWRWVEGDLLFSSRWRTEEQELGMTGLQKTVEVVCDMMNDVSGFLKMTMETCTDFEDETLPTLDMRLWVGNDNRTMYSFFEKPMSSNQVIQRKSAMPENMRMSTLNQEMVRRMMNTSELLDIKVRVGVVDEYCQKLCNSGYGKEQTIRVVTGGLTCYEKRVAISKDKESLKYRPLHESAAGTAGKRMKKKLLGKSNWFKNKKRPLEEDDDHGQEDPLGGRSPRKKRKPGAGQEDRPEVRGQKESKMMVLDADRSDRQAESKQGEGKKKIVVRKRKQMKQVRQDPPTISVMFVEQTAGGELAKRLQEAEDRLAGMTGYRVRMTETSGSKLCHLLPNTNPWSGRHCERSQCYTCNQGGERLEDCKRRNLLYESSCSKCQGEDDKQKRKGRGLTGKAVYVGETARSIFERSKEHWQDAQAGSSDSHMVKHWLSDHAEEETRPDFKFKVVATFKDALTRQIAESVRIDRRGAGVLNSRTEYSRCRLPRLTIDRSEWELAEMARKEREDVEIRNQMEVINEDDILGNEGGAIWSMGMKSSRTEKRKKSGIEEEKRKRKKRKLEVLVDWGGPMTEQEEGIRKWLEVDEDGGRSVGSDSSFGSCVGHSSRQKQLNITEYTKPVHDILTSMVEDWVMGEFMEMVLEMVTIREEVRLISNDREVIAELVDLMPIPALVSDINKEVMQEGSVAEKMVMKKVIHKKMKRKNQFNADQNKKMTDFIIVRKKQTVCQAQADNDPDVAREGLDVDALARAARLARSSRMKDSWGSRRMARSVVMEMVRGLEAQSACRNDD